MVPSSTRWRAHVSWAGLGAFVVGSVNGGRVALCLLPVKVMSCCTVAGHAVALRDLGPTMAPMNAFLTIMGIETLALRMKQHTDNARRVAEWLQSHEKVSRSVVVEHGWLVGWLVGAEAG